jgi:hypothetical protein
MSGKRVYPAYNDDVHCVKGDLELDPRHPVLWGWDFGLMAAAVCGQFIDGQLRVLREYVSSNMPLMDFAPRVRAEFQAEFGQPRLVRVAGDPTGDNRVGTDANTPFRILRQLGWPIVPASTNDPAVRIDGVSALLLRQNVAGQPALVITPQCRVLRQGFRGKYQYRRLEMGGAPRYEERPMKNEASHPHDGLQYMVDLLGLTSTLLPAQQSMQATVRPHSVQLFPKRRR